MHTECLLEDDRLSKIWDALKGDEFPEKQQPLVQLLCFWHAVADEAREQISKNGKLALFDPVAIKPFKGKNGEKLPMVRKSPALVVLKDATAEIRLLSQQLGITGEVVPTPQKSAKGDLLQLITDDRAKKAKRRVG